MVFQRVGWSRKLSAGSYIPWVQFWAQKQGGDGRDEITEILKINGPGRRISVLSTKKLSIRKAFFFGTDPRHHPDLIRDPPPYLFDTYTNHSPENSRQLLNDFQDTFCRILNISFSLNSFFKFFFGIFL
jgi:hypothetical protein